MEFFRALTINQCGLDWIPGRGAAGATQRPGRFTTETPMAMAGRKLIKAKLDVMELTPPTAFLIDAHAGRAAKTSNHGHCRPR